MADWHYIPLGILLPFVKTSQSPVPEGLSRSHTGRWERRWTTLVNPREETGRSSSKYSYMRGGRRLSGKHLHSIPFQKII